MVKITAVEWLLAKANYDRKFNLADALQEALQMEKEQILDAFESGENREYSGSMSYFENTYREI